MCVGLRHRITSLAGLHTRAHRGFERGDIYVQLKFLDSIWIFTPGSSGTLTEVWPCFFPFHLSVLLLLAASLQSHRSFISLLLGADEAPSGVEAPLTYDSFIFTSHFQQEMFSMLRFICKNRMFNVKKKIKATLGSFCTLA